MKKRFTLKIIVALVLIGVSGFLVGNYFYIRNEYKTMYVDYFLSQKYDINDIEIEKMSWSFKQSKFDCYYKQKSTGKRLVASKSTGDYVIEYTYASSGNLMFYDSWDVSWDISQ